MSRWFRWYEQTCEDGKFRAVARLSRVTVRDVIAVWAFMLEDAANMEHRGVCNRNEDFIASVLDFEDGEVERIISAMQDVGMLSIGAGAITVCNWNKRQFESDADPTASRRQREKRERDKEVTHAPVTRDTGGSEDRVQITDTEKKKEDLQAVAPATRPSDGPFEEFWKVYPKRDGANPKAPAKKKFMFHVKSGIDPAAIVSGANRYAAEMRSKGQIGSPYVAQAMTWLNQQRFDDYQPPPTAGPTNAPPPGAPTDEELRKRYGNPAVPAKTEATCENRLGADHGDELPRSGAQILPSLRPM
jgi:hypothetical protein